MGLVGFIILELLYTDVRRTHPPGDVYREPQAGTGAQRPHEEALSLMKSQT